MPPPFCLPLVVEIAQDGDLTRVFSRRADNRGIVTMRLPRVIVPHSSGGTRNAQLTAVDIIQDTGNWLAAVLTVERRGGAGREHCAHLVLRRA